MVTVYLPHYSFPFKHKEADGFQFHEGILHVTKGKEIIASYPQVAVAGVKKTDCCCQGREDTANDHA